MIRVHRSDLMISTCNKVFILQVRRISARSRHDSDLRWDFLYMSYRSTNDKDPKTLRSWNSLRQCFNHPRFAFAAFHSTWKTSTSILIKRRLTTWSTSRSKIRKIYFRKKSPEFRLLGPPADSGRGVDNLRRRTGRLARLWGWGHRPTEWVGTSDRNYFGPEFCNMQNTIINFFKLCGPVQYTWKKWQHSVTPAGSKKACIIKMK